MQLISRISIIVGPIWHGCMDGQSVLLASCYKRALEIAASKGVLTLAFHSISKGIYGFPIDLAAAVAVATVKSEVQKYPNIYEIVFCCFSESDLAVYERLLHESLA